MSTRFLFEDEILQREVLRLHIRKSALGASLPEGVEVGNGSKARQQIDPRGRDAELDDRVGLRQVIDRQAEVASASSAPGVDDLIRRETAEVLGETGIARGRQHLPHHRGGNPLASFIRSEHRDRAAVHRHHEPLTGLGLTKDGRALIA